MEKSSPTQAKGIPEDKIHRTVRLGLPASAWEACGSVARHVRDVHNSAAWLARTALGCFEKKPGETNWTLLAEECRPPDWREALDAFDQAIGEVNADRKAKSKEGESPKFLTPLGGGLNNQPLGTVLDQTLFHKACRDRVDRLDPQGQTAASRIPSHVGKEARERVRGSFSNWAKSLGAWKHSGSDPKPGMPGYFPKGDLPSFEFPLEQSTRRLPSLNRFEMKVGEDKSKELGEKAKAGWNLFELRKHVDRSLSAWGKAVKCEGAVAKRVRIHVGKNGGASMEIVVELPRSFPEGSFLAGLKKRHPEEWAKRGASPVTLEAWAKSLCLSQSWLPLACGPESQSGWISRRHSIVGADPGETNLLSLGFSGGQPMAVFSGHEFHKRTARLDQSIDRLAAKLCPQEERDLQAKREALAQSGKRLNFSELVRLRELAKARWNDPRILALRRKKKDYVRGEAHRLAAKAARLASQARAAVFVLSRNHGLKNASGRDSKQERKSHNIPHGLLAQLLRDKLDRLGIAMVETEESFTSLASFVDGDSFGVHSNGAKQEKAKAKRAAKKLAQASAALHGTSNEQVGAGEEMEKNLAEPPAKVWKSPSGASRSSDRRWLVRGGPFKPAASPGSQLIANPHRRRKVHADGQAALNSIRKISPIFGCSGKVNLGHILWSLSEGCWREMRV